MRINKYPVQLISQSLILWLKEKEREDETLSLLISDGADEVTQSILPARRFYAYLIHFRISGSVGFFPYMRMPTR